VGRVKDAERILQESPTTPAIGVDENAALVVVGNEALAVSSDICVQPKQGNEDDEEMKRQRLS
jgi:Flp pilus assembly protein TadD